MIVAIQQPEHLPWLGFFDKMQQCDLFILLDNVQFKKRYFENRNKILTPNGPQWVTVPVISKGRYTQPINEVEIDNSVNWQRKYLGSIQAAYSKATHFPDFYPKLEAIIMEGYGLLADLNMGLIEMFRDAVGIKTPMQQASEILPETKAKGSELILDLCKKAGATDYISGPDGASYLDTAGFAAENITLSYHDFNHPSYPQLQTGFTSHMSAVDALFAMGTLP